MTNKFFCSLHFFLRINLASEMSLFCHAWDAFAFGLFVLIAKSSPIPFGWFRLNIWTSFMLSSKSNIWQTHTYSLTHTKLAFNRQMCFCRFEIQCHKFCFRICAQFPYICTIHSGWEIGPFASIVLILWSRDMLKSLKWTTSQIYGRPMIWAKATVFRTWPCPIFAFKRFH